MEGYEGDEAFDELEAQPHGGALVRRRHEGSTRGDGDSPYVDPANFGWPPTLALELAMRVDTTPNICRAYGIERERWKEIAANPVFIAELAGAVEALRQDGMAFKARAGLQALELLKASWALIHAPATPPNVKADLIKSTVDWAGLNASKDKGPGIGVQGGVVNGFHINIQINNDRG